MNRAKDGKSLALRFNSRFSPLLCIVVLAGVLCGWLLDRSQLDRRAADVEMRCERRIDRMYLGLGALEEARTFASVYRRHQDLQQSEFSRYMQSTAILQIVNLFNFRGRIKELDLDESVTDVAQRLLGSLGCEDLDGFLEKAKRLGFKEEHFLFTYEADPKSREAFYRFIEDATRD